MNRIMKAITAPLDSIQNRKEKGGSERGRLYRRELGRGLGRMNRKSLLLWSKSEQWK